MRSLSALFVGLFCCSTIFAGVAELTPIPRDMGKFVDNGWYEGGSSTRVNLESVRLARHEKEGYERWVFDFSSVGGRVVGIAAPHFQLRYTKAETVDLPTGETITRKPARFVLLLESIQDNFLSETYLRQLTKRSHFIKRISMFPPIEKGDMALELELKENVGFAAHQPRSREGRLVLDLRSAPVHLP